MLINYQPTRRIITAHQPIELLSNGNFLSSALWTLGTGWSINTTSGIATKVVGAASSLKQDIVVTEGLLYEVIYTLANVTAGGLTQKIAGTLGTSQGASGTINEAIVAGAELTFRYASVADATFAGDVTNVSVMLSTSNTYDLEFGAVNHNLDYSTNKKTVRSIDNTSQTVVLNSELERYFITTKKIDRNSAQWLQFMEFFASVREGESFTFDEFGTVATPDNPVTVKIVGRETRIPLRGDKYRFSFNVEKI